MIMKNPSGKCFVNVVYNFSGNNGTESNKIFKEFMI